MKAQVDIVSGFLGSGKTSFINEIIKQITPEDKVLILQLEKGKTKIDNSYDTKSVKTETIMVHDELENKIEELVNKHKPKKVIIEQNGMKDLEEIFLVLEKPSIRRLVYLNKVINIIDALKFEAYVKNFGNIITEPIIKSDFILVTGINENDKIRSKEITKNIRNLNKNAQLFLMPKISKEFGKKSIQLIYEKDNKVWITKDIIIGLLIVLIPLYIMFLASLIEKLGIESNFFTRVEVFNTIFISILVQAFPFILAGVLVSAIIQIFISEDFIARFFPKNPVLAMSVGVLGGVFFPVCDCAIIPVMRGLIRKGIPFPAAITFMLAAPVVDPVVIVSTLYAFSGMPQVAIWRVVLGVTVSVIIGSVFFFYKEKNIMKEGPLIAACECGFCSIEKTDKVGVLSKFKGIMTHATSEFFLVGKYLIIGAAFSTFMQVGLPKAVTELFSENQIGALLIMMVFAFFLSICSTSDAFIARNFYNQFDLGPVMGFMVFGAVLDIKNLMLLSGTFKTRFLIKLISMIVIVSFIILYSFIVLT